MNYNKDIKKPSKSRETVPLKIARAARIMLAVSYRYLINGVIDTEY
jgi:hypothetical protein